MAHSNLLYTLLSKPGEVTSKHVPPEMRKDWKKAQDAIAGKLDKKAAIAHQIELEKAKETAALQATRAAEKK